MLKPCSTIMKRNQMCTLKLNSSIDDLPEEILAQSFKRLRVKYVLRCMCVQKSWYYLVRNPSFITLHRNYRNNIITNTHDHHPKYLLFQSTYTSLLTIRVDDRQCDEFCRFSYLPDLPESTWFAQSYGLICVTCMFKYCSNNNDIYLWNPLFQKYKTLPRSPLFTDSPHLSFCALAFGFVPQINDYVVVHIAKPPSDSAPNCHSVKISVYSLNTDSWKTINQENFLKAHYIETDHHVFVNGVAFWLGHHLKNHRIVMCFDTKTNILREILLPDWVEDNRPLLGIHSFGQSIAYFVENDRSFCFDMWVLKGDSINEFSWEKKMGVKLSDGDGCPENWHCINIRVEVLGLRNNGEPILFNLYNLVSYDLDSHKARDFIDSWDRWDDFSFYEDDWAPPFITSPFVESLALLDS